MHYQSFQDAVLLVASHGKGAFMAKENFKLAFHNIPMWYQDLNLLGIKVQDQFFLRKEQDTSLYTTWMIFSQCTNTQKSAAT